MILSFLEIRIPSLYQSNILFYFGLASQSLIIQPLENFSLFDIKPLSQLFKLACDLMFQTLIRLMDVSFLAFKLVLMHLQLFNLLADMMYQFLKLLLYRRICLSQCLYLMSLMLTVDDTLGTYWRTMASETKIGNVFLWML